MSRLVYLSLLIINAVLSFASAKSEGRAIIWTTVPFDLPTTYVTKSSFPQSLTTSLEKIIDNYDFLVLIKSPKDDLPSSSSLFNTFKSEKLMTVMSYIYQHNSKISQTPIVDNIKMSGKIGDIKELSVQEVALRLSDRPVASSDGKQLDIIQVELKDSEDALAMQKISHLEGNKVLFVAFEEPALTALVPAARAEYSLGTAPVSRKLASTMAVQQESIGGGEFSIYYAGTYLYITPDIFTGLMTGLFFFFVALVGVTCLGSIQGMSAFYDKCPPVGKEA